MGLVNKKVYTDSGDYVGKIKEIILGENKIDSLKIKVNKEYKINGVIVSYGYVKNVKDILIIDSNVFQKLDN